MSDAVTTALQISVVGMGLVFGSIFLLWLLMSVLVWATAERQTEETQMIQPDQEVEQENRRQAAATAVALALALEAEARPHVPPMPPTAIVSAWQAVMRSNILDKRGSVR